MKLTNKLPFKVGDKFYVLQHKMAGGKLSPCFVEEKTIKSIDYATPNEIIIGGDDGMPYTLNEVIFDKERAEETAREVNKGWRIG